MHISQVRLFQFRNLQDATIDLKPGAIFVSGRNGNGKTNFIEALYVLSGSKSFRTSTSSEFVRWGSDSCSVFGTVVHQNYKCELGVIYKDGKRSAVVDNNPTTSMGDFIDKLRLVAFAPGDLSLVKGAPLGRRKFLDRHMVDTNPRLIEALVSYQRALSNKSAVLKQGSPTVGDLEPWNVILAENGAIIAENRQLFVQTLEKYSRRYHPQFAAVDGELSLQLESDFIRDRPLTKEEIYNELLRVAGRETAQRSIVLGLQRDDIKITLGNDIDARSFASQGQTRSIVLALKLGVIDAIKETLNEEPVVLLDDVDSELDNERGSLLFEVLLARDRQLVVTGTGRAPYSMDKHPALQFIEVSNGVITNT